MSKFSKLFALASKTATNKTSTLVRKEAEGSVSLKFDGFPADMSAAAYEALAAERGARLRIQGGVEHSVGGCAASLTGRAAAEFVREMTTDDTATAEPAPRPTTPRKAAGKPSANGTHATEPAGAGAS
jgi:hypothetical protein